MKRTAKGTPILPVEVLEEAWPLGWSAPPEPEGDLVIATFYAYSNRKLRPNINLLQLDRTNNEGEPLFDIRCYDIGFVLSESPLHDCLVEMAEALHAEQTPMPHKGIPSIFGSAFRPCPICRSTNGNVELQHGYGGRNFVCTSCDERVNEWFEGA